MAKGKRQKRKFGFGSFCIGVACVVALGGAGFGIYKLATRKDNKQDTSQSEENKPSQEEQQVQATAEYKFAEQICAGI